MRVGRPRCPDPVFLGIALLDIITEAACGSVLFSLAFKLGVPTHPAQLPACTSSTGRIGGCTVVNVTHVRCSNTLWF